MQPAGVVFALGLRGVVPVHDRVHPTLSIGMFANTTGRVDLRDAQLSTRLIVVNRPDAQLVVEPGVSLPLGSVTSGLEYTLLATGSVDPMLGVEATVGSAWMGLARADVRVPVHPGLDRVQQGVFSSASLQVARRMGGGGVSGGVSFAGQTRRGFTAPGFSELAAVVNAAIPLGDRWGLQLGARVPVWVEPTPRPYYGALRIGIRRVFQVSRAH